MFVCAVLNEWYWCSMVIHLCVCVYDFCVRCLIIKAQNFDLRILPINYSTLRLSVIRWSWRNLSRIKSKDWYFDQICRSRWALHCHNTHFHIGQKKNIIIFESRFDDQIDQFYFSINLLIQMNRILTFLIPIENTLNKSRRKSFTFIKWKPIDKSHRHDLSNCDAVTP